MGARAALWGPEAQGWARLGSAEGLAPACFVLFFLVKVSKQFDLSLESFLTNSFSTEAPSTPCHQRTCCPRQITSHCVAAQLFLTLLFPCLLQTSPVG